MATTWNKASKEFYVLVFPFTRRLKSWVSLVQVVQQGTLGNYPVRTLEQLKAYINTLTYQQALTYLEKMKRYYIVEILPNGTAEIISVKLDMRID